jgi:hypothetical protein
VPDSLFLESVVGQPLPTSHARTLVSAMPLLRYTLIRVLAGAAGERASLANDERRAS